MGIVCALRPIVLMANHVRCSMRCCWTPYFQTSSFSDAELGKNPVWKIGACCADKSINEVKEG